MNMSDDSPNGPSVHDYIASTISAVAAMICLEYGKLAPLLAYVVGLAACVSMLVNTKEYYWGRRLEHVPRWFGRGFFLAVALLFTAGLARRIFPGD